MGLEAATKALLDAGTFYPSLGTLSHPHIASCVTHPTDTPRHANPGITYDAIEAAYVGYVFGASTCGQAALYPLGLTGIPITNVNNNCATGSTALVHAATLVRSGAARCALALGFERMAPGPLGGGSKKGDGDGDDRPSPLVTLFAAAARASPGADRGPPNPRVFGAAAAEYFGRYGGGVQHLAKIGELLFFFHFRCVSMDRFGLSLSGEEPQARAQQPVRAVPRGIQRSRGPRFDADHERAHQVHVQPHFS